MTGQVYTTQDKPSHGHGQYKASSDKTRPDKDAHKDNDKYKGKNKYITKTRQDKIAQDNATPVHPRQDKTKTHTKTTTKTKTKTNT